MPWRKRTASTTHRRSRRQSYTMKNPLLQSGLPSCTRHLARSSLASGTASAVSGPANLRYHSCSDRSSVFVSLAQTLRPVSLYSVIGVCRRPRRSSCECGALHGLVILRLTITSQILCSRCHIHPIHHLQMFVKPSMND
jgi:hypothetical protein